jgi:hypothetical protein
MRAARGQRHRAASRGVRAPARPMPLIAVPEGFPQRVPGRQGIALAQRPPALPPPALAPQFGPDGAAEGPAPRLGWVHQQRPPHARGTHHSQMVLALPVVGLTVRALLLQRLDRLIGALPPRPATAPAGLHRACTPPPGREPAEVWALGLAQLPGRDTLDPDVRLRSLEGPGIDPATARPAPRRPVVPCRRGAAPGRCRGLDLREHRGRRAGLHPSARVQTGCGQGREGGGSRPETGGGAAALQGGLILA